VRILEDEDLASRELLSRLDVAFPGEVLRPAGEASDDDVWRRAQNEAAAILTGNAVDFLRLAREHESHHGLILVHRTNKPTDLTASDILEGVQAISGRYPDGIKDLVLVINDHARRSR
jgi:predicted nuclease of predicted toxin-antitoxin system